MVDQAAVESAEVAEDRGETTRDRSPFGSKKEGKNKPKYSPMLDLVKDLVISPVLLEINTYVPSASFLAKVVSEVSNVINDDFRVRRSHPEFHPCGFHIYIGTLWALHITRVRVESNVATNFERNFTRNMIGAGIFNYRIPGPLVPFFQAVAYGYPKDAELNLIVPASLNSVHTRGASFDINDARMNVCYPLPYLRHALRALAHQWNQAAQPNQLVNLEWRCMAGAENAGPIDFDHAAVGPPPVNHIINGRLTPGLEDYDVPPEQLLRETARAIIHGGFKPPPLAAVGNYTISNYTGLTNPQWFVRMCERYDWTGAYFFESKRVEDIPRTGTCAGQFIAAATDVMANDNNYRDMGGPTLTREVDIVCPQFRPEPELAKLAALSQVNWRVPQNYGLNQDIGRNPNVAGSTLRGPYWTRIPDAVQSAPVNPTTGLRETILSMVNRRM
jgi:hypothetical protein